jgi:glutamyl-tRNA reductase
MYVGVIGISYKSAQLDLREELAAACHLVLKDQNSILLSTCNRTEIYFSSADLASTHSDIFHALKKVVATSFDHAMYSFFGRECFEHLAMVTAGLESAILGESDIQRQVKLAYAEACQRHQLSSALHFLFQKSLKMGKEVRSTFLSPMTLEGTVQRLVQNFFYEKVPLTIFMIGFSEINRKVGSALLKRSLTKMTFCTRSPYAAESFALDHGVSVVDWSSLDSWNQYDFVICGTHSSGYVISRAPEFLKTRLMLDLSVPRGISPDLNRCPLLTLLNMEEVGKLVEHERKERSREIIAIQKQVAGSVERQIEIFNGKQVRRVFV